ncbi:hypothetical protein ACF06P_31025 [Streptomyces sp. NPDC015684]|jgi:hypothetical protein|uniref:hypothetical protein n=1 Tax=Streptomyces sp. NPDC015684 TaxID=3364963 RepID=UPI0037033D9D
MSDPGDEREYPMYPEQLAPPYRDRFSAAAAQRYAVLGIERDDPDRPQKIAALNSAAFGAPVVLFFYLDRTTGPLVLYCGLSVGFEKEGVSRLRTGRADMAGTVSFIGG